MAQKFFLLLACLLSLFSPARAGDFQRPAAVHLDHDGEKWAQKTLKKLSLEEKIGQMFMVRIIMQQFVNTNAPDYQHWRDEISRYHLGSILLTVPSDGPLLSKSGPYEAAMVVNQLQHDSRLPLLVAADYERGLSMRLNGVTAFPHAMAFGATGQPALAEQFGKIVGEEARAIGVEWNLFPDADVNSNPANPVINTRSFGEDPAQVGAIVSAYIKGARAAGLLTAAKHFPGHGDTGTDSHLSVSAINKNREQLEQVDLVPFRSAIAAGVDAVMIEHARVPALDPAPATVATNSRMIITGVLKNELKFSGLVITDAMDMAGLTGIYPESGPAAAEHAAIDTVKAGNDMLLLPSDLDSAYNGLLRAVRRGDISEKRIDESVLKILRAKASVGLHKSRLVDLSVAATAISRPESLAFAQQVAESAMTLVRENGRVLPLKRGPAPATGTAYGNVQAQGNRLLCVVFTNDVRNDNGRQLERDLHVRVPDARVFYVDNRIAAGAVSAVQAAIASADNVIFAVYIVPEPGRAAKIENGVAVNTISLPESMAGLFRSALTTKPDKTVVLSFGSPYIGGEFPAIENYICAYSNIAASEMAAIKALFGEIPYRGRLPVTIPGMAARGSGLERATPSSRPN